MKNKHLGLCNHLSGYKGVREMVQKTQLTIMEALVLLEDITKSAACRESGGLDYYLL